MGTDTNAQRGPKEDVTRPVDRMAEFNESIKFEDLSENDVRTVERAFVDTSAVILSGMEEPPTTIAIDKVAGEGSTPLWGVDSKTSVSDSAFVHGIAGHSQDFDDVTWGMSGHPSVTMVPAILGIASESEVSGERAIEAYVAGFEAQCYLSEAINPSHYEKGWHATATLGTFGAAAAAAKALDLDIEETRHTLNIAASMAAGLKSNFGTMTKPLHVGQAARSGVTAAQLASGGFTAAADAVDGNRGFLELYRGDKAVSYEDLPKLENPTALSEYGLNVKKYPCCYYTHTSIYAAERVAEEKDVTPEDVESIHVVTSQGPADALHYPDPVTGLEGKFSLQYTVASAVARSKIDVEAFDDSAISDPAVQRVRERVNWEVDETLDYNDTTVELRLVTSEEEYTRVEDAPPGHPDNPMTDEELRDKFTQCAERIMDDEDVSQTYNRLNTLRSVSDLSDLV